ncbi:MAG TPA: ATP-dependent helicase [Methanothrix sp.]|nr:ATP-dependent helicase [Methanothrix sp.]
MPASSDDSLPGCISAEDAAILSHFHPAVREWWLASFGSAEEGLFTPAQRQAVPLIQQGRNALICSPTGSGKTLSAFISIISQLFSLAEKGELEESVYCLYISPLKSLANDIHRNLERPLQEMAALAGRRGMAIQEIRHAIRHGDISAQERARMLNRTPHILNTTPESLAILLSSPRFREKLKTVRWVIVDEIHSLAASKRGVHLSLSLERLEELKMDFGPKSGERSFPQEETNGESFIRIGCSATVEPLQEVADFLAGGFRPVEVVDCRFCRHLDLRLVSPVPDLISASQEEISDGLYRLLHRQIQDHKSTLIFANSRNGAERLLYNLRQRFPGFYDSENSACHHGSMGREGRQEAESRLKQGLLRVVCTSTSLELGIDMPYIDLVLQIGSPKSVAALLQRFGRGGHSLNQTVKGRIVALEWEDLLEGAVMLQRAKEGLVERIHIPQNAIDALCQHLLGMALERDWHVDEVLALVRRSYCYRSLTRGELMAAVLYLSSAHPQMRERRIYAKIGYDPATQRIFRLGGGSRMIYYTSSGMIPDQFTCDVFTREGSFVGRLDESYLERLEPGDVFSVGGKGYSFCYRRGGKVYVDPAGGRPSIPVWSSERLPLSFDLARAVLSFQGDLLWMMKREGTGGRIKEAAVEEVAGGKGSEGQEEDGGAAVRRWLEQQYHMDRNCSGMIYKTFLQQIAFLGEEGVPTLWRLVVQECQDREAGRRIFYVLSRRGLRCNEALARMAAYLLSRQKMGRAYIAFSDAGFLLSLPASSRASIPALLHSLTEENCQILLRRALQGTSLLQSAFRINAARSYLILRSYKGRHKSARHQQMDADMLMGLAESIEGFPVLEESYREIIEDRLEIDRIREVLRGLSSAEVEVVVKKEDTPCPLAFGLAALGAVGGERRERMKEMQRAVEKRRAVMDPETKSA